MIKPEQLPSGGESDVGIPAPNLQYRQNLSRLVSTARDEPLFLVWYFNLAAGQQRTIYCDSGIPDGWKISLLPAASLKLYVYNGPQASGDPLVFTGGGYAKLPAVNEYITLIANAGNCVGNVLASRKYDLEIYPGNLA